MQKEYYMSYLEYVVPIYCEKDFKGTGFIIGNTLITAAHVTIKKDNECHFLYRSKEIIIGPDNNILFEYPNDKIKQGQDNLYWDLAIYWLDNINSPIKLREPNWADFCIYRGYSDSTSQMDICRDIKLDNNAYYYPPDDAKPIRINNCYISEKGKCTHGNSGGPLFQGDSVIGMLSGGQKWYSLSWDRIIKAEHILKKIQEHDKHEKVIQ